MKDRSPMVFLVMICGLDKRTPLLLRSEKTENCNMRLVKLTLNPEVTEVLNPVLF